MAINLYKVYVQTEGHPHVLEMIVAGDSIESAKEKALKHVKESNATKGRDLKTSQDNSTVLAAKKAGMNGAIVVNKTPLTVHEEILKKIKKNVKK